MTATATSTCKIILADDHAVFRQGLKNMINEVDDFSVVAEADDGSEVLDLLRKHDADLVVLDLSMPGLNGIDTIEQIRGISRDMKILVLTMHTEKVYLKQAVAKGVNGYVVKSDAFDSLVDAIREIREGKAYFSQRMIPLMVGDASAGADQPRTKERLTKRETEVLRLIAAGKTSKAVAEELGISQRTVETHRYRMMDKLGLENMAELIKFAVFEGLT